MENIISNKILNSNNIKIIIGKQDKIILALTCLLSGGHILLEDIPGVGKTTIAKFLAKSLGLNFSRIQFTNDLLPSDILGTNIYDPKEQSFSFHEGPIFGELILADELNRASSKSQSALLEAMEEKKFTLDATIYQLPEIFFVIGTQNPQDQIGTNPLPESQLDRFMMKINMGHLSFDDEVDLLKNPNIKKNLESLSPQVEKQDILNATTSVSEVHISEEILKYIVRLVNKSRDDSSYLSLGPRAALDLTNASKAYAYLMNENHVTPEHIQYLFPFICGHRIVSPNSSYELGVETCLKLLEQVKVLDV